MENLPIYIAVAFGIVTLIAVWIFYKVTNQSKIVLGIVVAWLIIQGVISKTGFYTVTNSVPPRFAFLIFPLRGPHPGLRAGPFPVAEVVHLLTLRRVFLPFLVQRSLDRSALGPHRSSSIP